jgi:hypothetical protein
VVSVRPTEQVPDLRDYFELQLLFAARLADIQGLGPGEAVARYTNLRKRFGLDAPEGAGEWARYVEGFEAAGGAAAGLDRTVRFHAQAPRDAGSADQARFGCFACVAPAEDGVVRIHFTNRTGDPDVGPLAAARMPERLSELRAMFGFVCETWPQARSVVGGSWLYNLEAYRRLFPPAYGGSAQAVEGPLRLTGSSTWGQVLDHRGRVKPAIRDHLLARLDGLDPEAPWRAFPLRALRASAPIEAFFTH